MDVLIDQSDLAATLSCWLSKIHNPWIDHAPMHELTGSWSNLLLACQMHTPVHNKVNQPMQTYLLPAP
jgi:hypothetical protein